MKEKSVRKEKKEEIEIDYSKMPKEIESVIEPTSDITVGEANINSDGKQYLVRFPKDIEKAIGIKKGDKIKFRVELPSPKANQKEKIELTYVRG